MMIPWARPRGAIHDLAYIESLSADRNRLLCVSDRTLYLLHNLAALDIDMRARWAVEMDEFGYWAVQRGDPEDTLFRESANAFQLEVLDMSCDIVASLSEIRDAIAALAASTNTTSSVCCNYTFDPATYYEAAPGTGAPAELCDLAYSYALAWEAGANEMYHQFALGAFPSVGVLSAILDEFDLPGQALLQLVTLGAASTLPLLESIWQIVTANLVVSIACIIYNSAGSAEAKAGIYTLIESIPDIGDTAISLLEGPIGNDGLNKVYDGTFPIAIPESIDCATICGQENCGGPKWGEGCDPNDEGPCGSGDLTPGLARVWVATYDTSTASYQLYPYLDTNRILTFVEITGWTFKQGQPALRWFGCFDGVSVQLGAEDDPNLFPDNTCCFLAVVISATPFSIVANIGAVCDPPPP